MDPMNLPHDHPDRPDAIRAFKDPLEENATAPIDEHAIVLRISPLAWPEGADVMVHREAHAAFCEASRIFEEFEAFRVATQADQHLSDLGRSERFQQFARKILPALQHRLDKITEETAGIRRGPDNLIADMMGRHIAPPKDPNDIAVAAEIRAWLRAMPATERTSKVTELANKGDRTVIGAVLNAPAYLTGVDQDFIRQLQIDILRRTEPKRYATYKMGCDTNKMARRALDGVIRYVGGQAKTLAELRAPKEEAA